MEYLDYRKALGIGINDEQKQILFCKKILNFFTIYNGLEISFEEYFNFCQTVGIRLDSRLFSGRRGVYIADVTNKIFSGDFKEQFCKLIIFFNVCKIKIFKKDLKKCINDSLNECKILYEIVEDADGLFYFPKGAEELDKALITEPLEWLESYPNIRKQFVDCLKKYNNQDKSNIRDIADDLRKVLENFMQEFFKKPTTSLENFKSEYGKYLQKKGVPKEISNNLCNIINAYIIFNNNHAKHQNKTEQNVLEYILYATGNIIRLLLTLNQKEKNENGD